MRMYFLDNLKTFVVNLMILLHVGLCYIAGPLPWWYVLDSDLRLEMTYWVLDTDMTIMPMMFFISGYFAIKSLAKRRGWNFWRGKVMRIGIPWLVGITIFAPIASFIMPLSRGLTDNFQTYLWEYYFFNPATGGTGEFFNHVPYWYLGVLLFFYAILYVFCELKKNYSQQLSQKDVPSAWFFIGITLFTIVNSVVVNMITGNEYLWVPIGYLTVIQPSRILLYVLFFYLGVYAWKHHWFEVDGYIPSAKRWTLPLILSCLFFPWSLCHAGAVLGNPLAHLLCFSLGHALLLTTAVFGWLALFYQFFNYSNNILGELAANSYTMYYCHILFIFWPVYYMMNWHISPFSKFFIASIIGLIISYLVSKVLLQTPFFAASKKAKVK